MKYYIFDLDMTLLDSSNLEAARSAGYWAYVMSCLDTVTPFVTSDGIVHEFVAQLKKSGKVIGIVTSSPRDYSEYLLKKFNIPYDYLVSGSDVKEHKPNPEGILSCMRGLSAVAGDTVYIGDTINDFIAAYRAGIKSVGVSWGQPHGFTRDMYSKSPDVVIKSPKYLLANLKDIGFQGEVVAATNSIPPRHRGDLITFMTGNIRYRCLGRFFDTKHARHNQPLSKAILKFKNDDSDRKIFVDSITKWLHADSSWRPDLILSVPPKPSDGTNPAQIDRFINLRNDLARILSSEDGQQNYLRCKERVDNYKLLKLNDRTSTSDRIYEVLRPVVRRNILLIDDVVTTGSTTTSIAYKLLYAGATDVRCIGLGLNQRDVFDAKICPKCGANLRLRTNRRDGSSFWGCINFYSTGCNHTENCN